MALLEKELTLFNISPTLEVATGDTIYQVLLGESIDVDAEMQARMQLQFPGPIPKLKKTNALWLMINIKGEVLPYRIGSKWKLTVSDNGNLDLKEIKV